MSEHNETPKVKVPESLITPEAQSYLNQAIAASVKEAVAAVFAGLAPTLQSMALTPAALGEAIKIANTHQPTPAEIAKIKREERESLQSREQDREMREQIAARKANCPHADKNGKTSICITHNFPDHQPRGICPLCGDWIHPREWRIAATVEEAAKHHTHQGKAYVCEEHKNYRTVAALESFS